ncbi:MAG: hypothetical protein C0177_07085 [Fervidicoccus fontis]|uniref:Endonuclease V n=2 Tax=Fervidicoccus fontis TaxID=683846 RepID=A0A2J6N4L2_9CREN|nr:MAG: hypothetical protein C0188_03395 [Fervidicoccus fontis]PMB76260.1 MAG: hypothetical protein C0177_07085 [Fervidicoccus fontis]HEW64232.1 endonuclease V [Fervidicoccus fontis]
MFMKRRFSIKKAKASQLLFKEKAFAQLSLIKTYLSDNINIAAVDCAFTKGKEIIASAVAYRREENDAFFVAIRDKIRIPYIPGFLGFREVPVAAAAVSILRDFIDIDLLLVDGHGIAHPRFSGSATHLGLALDIPTIGVAKSLLVYDKIDEEGNFFYKGILIGKILSYPENARKLYISPGYKIPLEKAFEIVKNLRKKPGLPFPLNYADKISKKVAKDEL